MNKIINKFLIAVEKFMLELRLKLPRFTDSVCWPFTKHQGRIKKFRETGNLKHLNKNKLYKSCFAYDGA